MDDRNLEERVISLHAEAKWPEIVELGVREESDESRRLLWVWPSFDDLRWLRKNVTRKYRLRGIASIGCGSGLLEWIIQRYSGCDIIGVETDKSWWSSGYAPPMFLKNVIFLDEEETDVRIPTDHALLFCYFNNGPAFQDYVNAYEGNVVVVIGPDETLGRTTDPLPFDEKFKRLGWKIRDARKLDNCRDFATVYTRLSSIL